MIKVPKCRESVANSCSKRWLIILSDVFSTVKAKFGGGSPVVVLKATFQVSQFKLLSSSASTFVLYGTSARLCFFRCEYASHWHSVRCHGLSFELSFAYGLKTCPTAPVAKAP